tara:strand:+ start:266 stop:409 length:144 start_codon:yes stop_codon:yes gene_type:complete
MSIKSDALWTMADRYRDAAANEKDLSKAEELTAKAVKYWTAWQEAVQ